MKLLIVNEKISLLRYAFLVSVIIFSFYIVAHNANASDVAFYVSTTTRYGTTFVGSNTNPYAGTAFYNYYGDQDLSKFSVYILENNVDNGVIDNDYDFCLTSYHSTSMTQTPIFCETKTGAWLDANIGLGYAGSTWIDITPTTTITLASSTYYEVLIKRNAGSSVDSSELGINYGQNTLIYSTTERYWYKNASTKQWDNTNYRDFNLVLYETGIECGNGSVESPEECDDGNTNDFDGCSSICVLEETTFTPTSYVWQPYRYGYDSSWLTNVSYIQDYNATTTGTNLITPGNWFKHEDYYNDLTFNGVRFLMNNQDLNKNTTLKLTILDSTRTIVGEYDSVETSTTLDHAVAGSSTQPIIFYMNDPITMEYFDEYYFMVSLNDPESSGAYLYTVSPYYSNFVKRYNFKQDYAWDGQWRLDSCGGGDNTCNARFDNHPFIVQMELLFGSLEIVPTGEETYYFTYPYSTSNYYDYRCDLEETVPFYFKGFSEFPISYYSYTLDYFDNAFSGTPTSTITDNLDNLYLTENTYTFTIQKDNTATTTTKHRLRINLHSTENDTSTSTILTEVYDNLFYLTCSNTSVNSPINLGSFEEEYSDYLSRSYLEDKLKYRAPFSYLYDIYDMFSNVAENMNEMQDVNFDFHFKDNTTTTMTFISSSTPYQFVGAGFWNVLRNIIRAFLWLAVIMYVFYRLKNFRLLS